MKKPELVGLVFAACAFGSALLATTDAVAQGAPGTVVVVEQPPGVVTEHEAQRLWFVSLAFGGGYNHFALDTASGARTYSTGGPTFTIQGGVRFRHFAIHATVLANIALDPGFSGLTANYGAVPVQNAMHLLLGGGATFYVPSTPIHVGASVGLGGMFLNFEKVGADRFGAPEAPNSQANVGFGAALQAGATWRLPKLFDVFVEAVALVGRYRAGDSAPADVALSGASASWTSLSVGLQLGLRY